MYWKSNFIISYLVEKCTYLIHTLKIMLKSKLICMAFGTKFRKNITHQQIVWGNGPKIVRTVNRIWTVKVYITPWKQRADSKSCKIVLQFEFSTLKRPSRNVTLKKLLHYCNKSNLPMVLVEIMDCNIVKQWHW